MTQHDLSFLDLRKYIFPGDLIGAQHVSFYGTEAKTLQDVLSLHIETNTSGLQLSTFVFAVDFR